MKGFKDFLMRGNLVEIAVGLIIASSFGLVVTAFTNLLLSAISKAFGANPNFNAFEPWGLPVGQFLTALVAFLILATFLGLNIGAVVLIHEGSTLIVVGLMLSTLIISAALGVGDDGGRGAGDYLMYFARVISRTDWAWAWASASSR